MHNVQKGPCAHCGQRRSRSPCTSVQSNLGNFSLSTYTTVSTVTISGQRRPRSACTYAQVIRACDVRNLHKALFMCCVSYDRDVRCPNIYSKYGIGIVKNSYQSAWTTYKLVYIFTVHAKEIFSLQHTAPGITSIQFYFSYFTMKTCCRLVSWFGV